VENDIKALLMGNGSKDKKNKKPNVKQTKTDGKLD
jgi:hypothetical protein